MIWLPTRVGISGQTKPVTVTCTLERDLLYSCSMDGEIKVWSVASPGPATCLRTALQTGPSGEGADMAAMGGLSASLAGEVVTVRKIVFWRDKLYAGDEMDGLSRCSNLRAEKGILH